MHRRHLIAKLLFGNHPVRHGRPHPQQKPRPRQSPPSHGAERLALSGLTTQP